MSHVPILLVGIAALALMASRRASAVSLGISTGYELPPSAEPYRAFIVNSESENALPSGLLGRLLKTESNYRPDIISGQVTSKTGAQGIAQFEPATAKARGVNPLDPQSAINGAGEYLAYLYGRFRTWGAALVAYNWGEGNVARYLANPKDPTLKSIYTHVLNTYAAPIMRDVGLM